MRDSRSTTPIPPQHCAHCGALTNRASGARDIDIAPKPGDFNVCGSCGAFGRYDATLKLRLVADLDSVPATELDDDDRRVVRDLQSRFREMRSRCRSGAM